MTNEQMGPRMTSLAFAAWQAEQTHLFNVGNEAIRRGDIQQAEWCDELMSEATDQYAEYMDAQPGSIHIEDVQISTSGEDYGEDLAQENGEFTGL